MLKWLSVIVLIIALFPIASQAQNNPLGKKAPIIFQEPVTQINSFGLINPIITAASYVAVDTMNNAYGLAIGSLNPLAYDPASGVGAILHRAATTYGISSGELWYNYTTDFGLTWTRTPSGINSFTQNVVARYPSMCISNPSGGDISATTAVFSWPELTPSAFGFVGYGADFPVGGAAPFAAIDEGPPAFGSNVPCWASDNSNWVFWASDNSDDASVRIFRTEDFGTISWTDLPSSDFSDGGNIAFGGMAFNGIQYYGLAGTYADPNPGDPISSGWYPGYFTSADNGATWSAPVVVDFRTIPALSNYDRMWDWKKDDVNIVSYQGDLIVDGNGYVHMTFGVTDTSVDANSGSNAIVEVFETASGWDGKVIFDAGTASDSTDWTYGVLDQSGYSAFLSRNADGNFYVAQWAVGTTGDTLVDIWASYRQEGGEWSDPMNLTESDNIGETLSHLAPYMKQVDNVYTFFTLFGYDETGAYPPDDVARTVIYAAPVDIIISAVDDPKPGVYSFQLDQNYPNPFNPSTTINYSIAEKGNVTLKVFDVLGNEIATIVNSNQEAGNHTVSFDASNLSSGVYVYTLSAGSMVSSQKMILMK